MGRSRTPVYGYYASSANSRRGTDRPVAPNPAAAMLTELTWDPVLGRIGPDWLVNELMMRIHKRTPIDCIHTEPTILGHGSFLVTHESHIQTRSPQKG